jgi:hypothetical protein
MVMGWVSIPIVYFGFLMRSHICNLKIEDDNKMVFNGHVNEDQNILDYELIIVLIILNSLVGIIRMTNTTI